MNKSQPSANLMFLALTFSFLIFVLKEASITKFQKGECAKDKAGVRIITKVETYYYEYCFVDKCDMQLTMKKTDFHRLMMRTSCSEAK